MVATVEEHTGSWGHRGPVNGLSIKSVQIPRHPGCRCVCILVDRETMCLSNSCSVSQMLNDPLSHVQFFFSKEKFPNLTTGKVAQVAGRVSMAYQKARDTQRQGLQSQTKREKSRCLHWGPLKERFSNLTFLPKEMSLSLVHAVSSLHIRTMVPSLWNCHFHSENERQTLPHELLSFLSFCSISLLSSWFD